MLLHCSTDDVTINADGSCGGGWVCEHRWPAIAGMAGWAKATSGEDVGNWYENGNVVSNLSKLNTLIVCIVLKCRSVCLRKIYMNDILG